MLANDRWQNVLQKTEGDGQQGNQDGAEDGAENATQPANDDHQHELERFEHTEHVGSQV